MQQLDFWIRKRASQSPNKVALIQIESGEAWTYEQLMKHAYWWSEQFIKYRLERGDRIASLMENWTAEMKEQARQRRLERSKHNG